RSAAEMSLPAFRIFVAFGSTANVHSASLPPLALPDTTRVSAAAVFTVPLALCAAGFLASIGFLSSALGAVAGGGVVVLWASTLPAVPATNATPSITAMSLFTIVPPCFG